MSVKESRQFATTPRGATMQKTTLDDIEKTQSECEHSPRLWGIRTEMYKGEEALDGAITLLLQCEHCGALSHDRTVKPRHIWPLWLASTYIAKTIITPDIAGQETNEKG